MGGGAAPVRGAAPCTPLDDMTANWRIFALALLEGVGG